MENEMNDKHIHGDVQDPNVTEATTPLDDASCCASSSLEEKVADFLSCDPRERLKEIVMKEIRNQMDTNPSFLQKMATIFQEEGIKLQHPW
jgi:hypothetical protein